MKTYTDDKSDGPRVLVADVETSPIIGYTWGLRNQFLALNQIIEPTRVICWAAKWHGDPRTIFRSEYHHGHEAMVRKAWELLDEADVVVGFNSKSFDEPHLRREFEKYKLGPTSPYKTVDLYRQLKGQWRFPSYKLDYIAQTIGVGAKVSHQGFDLWRACIEPVLKWQYDSEAEYQAALKRQREGWRIMKKYNIGDIVVTDDLYAEALSWLPDPPNLGLYVDTDEASCPSPDCGSVNLRPNGYRVTKVAKYQAYQCRDCGKYSQSGKAVKRVDLRPV